MASKRISMAQSAKLAQLTNIHQGYMEAKASLRARIEQEFALKLRDWELRESRAMNEALALGVPKTVIGRTVGLANWGALEDKYELTRYEYKEKARDTAFTFDTETSTLFIQWIQLGNKKIEDEFALKFYPSPREGMVAFDHMTGTSENQIAQAIFDALINRTEYAAQAQSIVDEWYAAANEYFS